jgi:hypothetical protein
LIKKFCCYFDKKYFLWYYENLLNGTYFYYPLLSEGQILFFVKEWEKTVFTILFIMGLLGKLQIYFNKAESNDFKIYFIEKHFI